MPHFDARVIDGVRGNTDSMAEKDDPRYWDIEETLVCISTHGGLVSWWLDLCRQGIAAHPMGWYRKWLNLTAALPQDEPDTDDDTGGSASNEYDPHQHGSRLFLRRDIASLEVRSRSLFGVASIRIATATGSAVRYGITVPQAVEQYRDKIRKTYPGLYRDGYEV